MHVLGKKRSKISWLRFYLTKLEKEKQIKSKVSRENKWEEINKIENRKAIGNINETKVWFFKKINEIDWTLVRLSIKKKRARTQVIEIRNEREDITTKLWTLKG